MQRLLLLALLGAPLLKSMVEFEETGAVRAEGRDTPGR